MQLRIQTRIMFLPLCLITGQVTLLIKANNTKLVLHSTYTNKNIHCILLFIITFITM